MGQQIFFILRISCLNSCCSGGSEGSTTEWMLSPALTRRGSSSRAAPGPAPGPATRSTPATPPSRTSRPRWGRVLEPGVLMVTVPAGGGCQVRGGEGPGRGAAEEDLRPAVHCLPAPHHHRHHHQALASRHARDTLQKRFKFY